MSSNIIYSEHVADLQYSSSWMFVNEVGSLIS